MSRFRDFSVTALLQSNVPLTLLIGQAVALGTLLAFVIVGGNTLFLEAYGSALLPAVYIVIAIFGSAIFYGMAALQNRLPLTTVIISTIVGVFIFYLFSWIGLILSGDDRISFGLMVSFSMMLQLGFVVLGGQAGRLFNVREIKRLFPKIVAGFVVGFLIGGSVAPFIVAVRGQTADLILGAAVAAAIMLGFLLDIVRRYYPTLAQVSERRRPLEQRKPLSALLLRRFVLLIVGYQFLSAMATQLINYIFLDLSAARFATETELARFFSNFTVAINGIDLIFLVFVAGWFLVRFGLRLGLMANPIVNLFILIVQLVVGLTAGLESSSFFWLVMIAWIGDVAFTDGTTRGSINTAYQALPVEDRAVVQTGVEGIGFPLALGLTGVILLGINAIPGLTIVPVIILSIVVMGLWSWVALLTYRSYGEELTAALKRRTVDLTHLDVDEKTTRQLLHRLLSSSELADVRNGVALLATFPDPSLDGVVVPLLASADRPVRIQSLNIIERRRLAVAAPSIKKLIESESDPEILGAGLRTLGVLDRAAAEAFCTPYLDHESDAVRAGALAGVVAARGERGAADLKRFASSTNSLDRAIAARVIGELESVGAEEAWFSYLVSLAEDRDIDVQAAALLAAGQSGFAPLLPAMWRGLSDPHLRSTAVTALIHLGDDVLQEARRILSGPAHPWAETAARICGQINSEAAVAVLDEQITHPDDLIRTRVLSALARSGYRSPVADFPTIFALICGEHDRACYLLSARRDLAELPAVSPLLNALDDEMAMVIERIGYLCALLVDARAIMQAMSRLQQRQGQSRALAFELLEVMLPRQIMNLIGPLLDPRLSLEEKTAAATRTVSIIPFPIDDRIEEIAAGDGPYQLMDWTRACAFHAGGLREPAETFIAVVEKGCSDPAAFVREAAVWALARLAPARFERRRTEFLRDQSERVKRAAKMAPGVGNKEA